MIKHSGYTNFWAVSGWLGLISILFVLAPDVAFAQTTFKSLVTIPGISDNPEVTENFGLYINALYIFAITVGAMLAVLKLVAAGVKYMFSDIVTSKESAKSDIKGALLGLLIVIGAVVVLNTINTDLTKVDLNFESVDVDTGNYLGDAIDRLQDLITGCTEPECEIKDCPFWRITITCREWCREQGPNTTYIPRGPLSAIQGGQSTHQCLIRYEGNELAESQCIASGKIWDNITSSCRDQDDDREIENIRCIEDRNNQTPDGGFTYDCTQARLQCESYPKCGEDISAPNATRIACALPEAGPRSCLEPTE